MSNFNHMMNELRIMEIILNDEECWMTEDVKAEGRGEKMMKKKVDLGDKMKEILEPHRGADWLVKAMELYELLMSKK